MSAFSRAAAIGTTPSGSAFSTPSPPGVAAPAIGPAAAAGLRSLPSSRRRLCVARMKLATLEVSRGGSLPT